MKIIQFSRINDYLSCSITDLSQKSAKSNFYCTFENVSDIIRLNLLD